MFEINEEALMMAQGCYGALGKFRRERERNKKFNYGDQWSDLITLGDQTLTEAQALKRQGAEPLKNNLIRRLVRNVLGVYSAQANEPRCVARDAKEKGLAQTMTGLLKFNAELNRLSAVNMRTLEEFLISGLAVQRKWFGMRNGHLDCWTDMVSPDDFFIDAGMRDCRGWDCRCIGQLHDVSFGELCSQFARSPEDCRDLGALYGTDGRCGIDASTDFGFAASSTKAFLGPARAGFCRVIEVWRKEYIEYYACQDPQDGRILHFSPQQYAQEIRRRQRKGLPALKGQWTCGEKWRYYFLAPSGHVLAQGDTPYAHGKHPFVVKAYPLIDGEIHAFVADVIDQQKYTNRLISCYDWIIRSSAKGVLMIPEDCIPYGSSPREFADVWARCNGVLVYRPSMQGDVPKQVASNSTNVGINELLSMQLKFFEDISGVHGALEGRLDSAGISGALYGQQTQNATIALQDVLTTFGEFVRDCAYIDVRNMQQFYDPDRVAAIVGACDTATDLGNGDTALTLLARLRQAEFDLSVSPATSTPWSRQASNQLLLEIWKSGQITLDQLLTAGDFPFADALKQTANASKD